MNSLASTAEEQRERASFLRMWLVAFVVALVSVVPIMLLKERHPWVVLIPISIGAYIVLAFEVSDDWADFRNRQRTHSMTGYFYFNPTTQEVSYKRAQDLPLQDSVSSFWLELKRFTKPSVHQLDLFEKIVTEDAERRRVRVLPTEHGDVYVISCERFIELLVSKLLDSTDKATEHALAVTWKGLDPVRREELRAILNKTVRETIKNDLRGTFIKLVSDGGAGVIQDLLKDLGDLPQPTTARRRGKHQSGGAATRGQQ
ncbi:MAG TPA: hypothetical protein VMV72_00890 [Verrucomicrobiae bacterium]|nr:hypothetical protein [Verrucomicrobiae bacterium]